MSLINPENNDTEIENTDNVDTEINNEQAEQTTETNETETEPSFMDKFKEYKGEDFNEKSINTFEKFSKDGNLDPYKLLDSYDNLQKEFSKKREAPEEYSHEYSEDIAEEYRFNDDAPLVKGYHDIAKELNLTQEQHSGILNFMSKYTQEDTKAQIAAMEKAESEARAAIPNFDSRVGKMQEALKHTLTGNEEGHKELLLALQTDAGIKAVETLIASSKDKQIRDKSNTKIQSSENITTGTEDKIAALRKEVRENKSLRHDEKINIKKQIRELLRS